LVIGSADEMGKYSCRILAEAEDGGEVIVADRNAEAAERLAPVFAHGVSLREPARPTDVYIEEVE
jgi:NAD(P)-dependent dehydrogenase (short-subunit alcohol dehydrogenase family)